MTFISYGLPADVQSDSTSESHFEPRSIFISHYPCPKDGEQAKQLEEFTKYLRQYDYTVISIVLRKSSSVAVSISIKKSTSEKRKPSW